MNTRLLFGLAIAVSLALGLGTRAETLHNGFASDDYVEAAMLSGDYPVPRGPLDLFNFTAGTHQENRALMDFGALPWWSSPDLRLAMWRPLASALVGLDHALFGPNEWAYHAHSWLWWCLGVLVVALLFRRLLPPEVAALAVLIFALEEGHTLPLGWLANRGALVAMTLAMLGCLLHLHSRAAPTRLLRASTIVVFLIAFSVGEWAYPFIAYPLAYELLGAQGSARERARAILPVILIALGALATRTLLGYGTTSSGVYIDPLSEPLRFAYVALARIPLYVADLTLGLPARSWDFRPPWAQWMLDAGWLLPPGQGILVGIRPILVALGTLALLGIFRLLRSERFFGGPQGARTCRWLLLGSLLSLFPMVSSFPASRLVVPAAIGVSAAIATLSVQAARYCCARYRRAWPRVLLVALCLLAVAQVHLLDAGGRSRADTQLLHLLYKGVRDTIRGADLGGENVQGRRVVLLTANEHTTAVFTPFVWRRQGRAMPRSFWTLSAAPAAHVVHRIAPDQLDITIASPTFLASGVELLYRAPDDPFMPGASVRIDGLHVTRLAGAPGTHTTLRFKFDRSLDDPQYLFITATPTGIRRVTLPEVGERLDLAPPGFPGWAQAGGTAK